MRRGWWVEVAKACAYSLGVANIALLIVAESTTLTLVLALLLGPFTLALALKLTAVLACGFVSLAIGDPRERAELLVSVVAGAQPPSAGEQYREAMQAEISVAPTDLVATIRINLMKTATHTILAAWAQCFRRLWKRARPQKVS